ncbi:MAG: hypothetical protein F4X68_01495 [Acidimicrobiia bacterium]|nr:hypothetical protein [Acidimicrobiia bacterium]MYB72629.1 hypothetical protein [Acidimicrobiia bacterium]
MSSYKTKLIWLYSATLSGAILAEIEVHRVGHWGSFNPLRAIWIVALGATPSILILARTPMRNKGTALISAALATLVLLLGIFSAHSESSMTWVGHIFLLWAYGVLAVLLILAVVRLNGGRK